MPQQLSTEYDIDPCEYIDRLEAIVTERHPPTRVRRVEEVVFVDGGPVDYLAWFALDGYDDHTFFYDDDAPDAKTLRRLLSTMPSEAEMPTFRAWLRAQHDTYETVDPAALFEIPDTYLPQFTPRPRANVGFFYSPVDDAVAVGINAVPRTKEERILEDVEKLLPSRDVERFVGDVVRELYDEVEADAERHVVDRDVRPQLESDPDFRRETVTSIPDDVHPELGRSDAELWQKPASRVPHLDGAQGFLQVWLPEATEGVALVTLTRGDYDAEAVVERTRDRLLRAVP